MSQKINNKTIEKGKKIVDQKRQNFINKLNSNPQNDLDHNGNDLIKAQYRSWTTDSLKDNHKSIIKAFLALVPFSLFFISSILLFLNIFDAVNLLINEISAICFAILSAFIIIYSVYLFNRSYRNKYIFAYLNNYPSMQEI